MEHLLTEKEELFMTIDGRRNHTVDEILALPDGERAELLDGELFMMATPTTTHQIVLIRLAMMIQNYIDSKKGKCMVMVAPFGVFLKNDDKNYVEPDVVVICDKDKLDNQGCHGAPDWAIEVVSPSSKTMDYHRKLEAYRTAGVREYWIIDPEKESVIVYDLEHEESPAMYRFTDKVKTGIIDGLKIDFAELKNYLF